MRTFKRLMYCALFVVIFTFKANAQENKSYILHTVEKGQSLYSISSMYGVSQSDIVKLNPGSDEKIFVGGTLRIPITPANSQKETFHTIAAGETLYRLTLKYGVSAQDICDANPGLSADNFRIGQVIRIPNSSTPGSPARDANDGIVPTASTQIPGPVQSRCREMHKVQKKESLFSISRQYGVTEADIIAANPELKGGNVKKGDFLCIPYPTAQIPAQTKTTPTDTQLFTESRRRPQRMSIIKAAIILPFVDSDPGEAARMTEYYEGFLMAVDSMKRSGTSMDIYTYNSGSDVSSLNSILAKSEMKKMDLIFGPLYQDQIKPLADFAGKNNIRLVIPFTSKDNTVFRNPTIYQVNTPQSYLYSEVYEHFLRQFQNANIIFIEATNGSKDKVEFLKGLRDELRSRAIVIRSVKEDATPAALKSVLNPNKPNIFIPTSGSNVTLIKILPQLVLLTRENPESKISLFGYPEWQTYTKDHLDAFFELDTYFYSSFYTNNLLPAAINFTKDYRRWFRKDMDERYPKFGMLGFDTGYFFLKGLSLYGSDLEKNMQRMDLIPIQTGFKFQRVNNWGGFINKKVYFVHFTRNYELLKLDFD